MHCICVRRVCRLQGSRILHVSGTLSRTDSKSCELALAYIRALYNKGGLWPEYETLHHLSVQSCSAWQQTLPQKINSTHMSCRMGCMLQT